MTIEILNGIAELVELDKRVDFAEGEGIRQRWLFGQELLARRVGKKLPNGFLDELVEKTGKSRQELQFRASFAERFVDDDALSNAIRQYKSWYEIVNYGLTGKSHRNPGDSDNEWYTPAKYIEAARKVMGGIDLDPASSDIAQIVVNAGEFFTKEQDGLKQEWSGRVWLNPPYSRTEDAGSQIYPFIDKLVDELTDGKVEQAILLTHNSADVAWFHKAEEIAKLLCFTRGRIAFVDQNGEEEGMPTQGQTFFYYGDNEQEFRSQFSDFGFIR